MYSLIESNGGLESITVLIDGQLVSAVKTHPNFDTIVAGARAGDFDGIADLFDVGKAVAAKLERLSERVTVGGGHVYFDGDRINNTLTNKVLEFLEAGEDFKPLVNFFERVMQNPQEHSREQLYRWLDKHNFTITEDGDFLAYKGVQVDNDGAVGFRSVSAGTALVNGVSHNGRIPQSVGDVVEMPRTKVAHDPAVGCSTGLHAGTWSYASGFARGAVVRVKINPRDVVSVPTDSSDQKLRVCRYTVQEVIEQEDRSLVYRPAEDVLDDEELCECDNYYDECDCDEFEVDPGKSWGGW